MVIKIFRARPDARGEIRVIGRLHEIRIFGDDRMEMLESLPVSCKNVTLEPLDMVPSDVFITVQISIALRSS